MELDMRVVECIVLTALVLSGSLHSQTRTLTLEQAKRVALENNLNVIQAQNNIEGAQSDVLAAYGNFLPTLGASGGWNRTQSDVAGSTTEVIGGQAFTIPSSFTVADRFSTRLDLNYTVFDGFAREANFSSAKSDAIATEHQSARTRQTIVFEVARGYLNVLRNEQLVKVSGENLKRDHRQLERITESNRVGALSLADVYRQQSQVAADELNLINAQNDYEKAKADLVALIGLDVSAEYDFADPTISTIISQTELDTTLEQYKDFSALSGRALASRPDYLSAQENFGASESGVTAARSGYFPSVFASAGYGLSNEEFSKLSNNKNITWGIKLRWDLFDGFRTNQALQSANVIKRNAEISLIQAQRDINVELKKALLDLDAARKQYEVSQKGLISATEDRKIAEERYNLGAGTLLDLLIANAGLVNAQASQVNATYSYIVAKHNVEYVLGENTY
jgi:outer membrane protein